MRTGVLAVFASLADLRQEAMALVGRHASLHIGGLRRGTGADKGAHTTIAANNLEGLIAAEIMISLPIDLLRARR